MTQSGGSENSFPPPRNLHNPSITSYHICRLGIVLLFKLKVKVNAFKVVLRFKKTLELVNVVKNSGTT